MYICLIIYIYIYIYRFRYIRNKPETDSHNDLVQLTVLTQAHTQCLVGLTVELAGLTTCTPCASGTYSEQAGEVQSCCLCSILLSCVALMLCCLIPSPYPIVRLWMKRFEDVG